MNALERAVHDGLSRLLTLVDRAPGSPSLGAADRSFWCYRTDKDYPSATYAQIAWPLALIATRPELGFDAPTRARSERICRATMRWWTQIQHRDGSFDEWFHYERSHVATAFTSFAVSEAVLLLDHRRPHDDRRSAVLAALQRAASWLDSNTDPAVANHQAGSIAALANIDQALGRGESPAYRRQLEELLLTTDGDGFAPEYGGVDPGYASVTLAFLTLAERRRPSPELASAIDRMVDSLQWFVQPDGSFGGTYGRRATRYAWLTGFALRATGQTPGRAAEPSRGPAHDVLAQLVAGLERGSLAGPGGYDDRYFCFFAFPDAVAAMAAITGDDEFTLTQPLTMPIPAKRRFEAGLLVARGDRLHVVIGASVGGTISVHLAGSGRLLFDDSGYVGAVSGGELVSSWRHGAAYELDQDRVTTDGSFAIWTRSSPVARNPVAFRVFNRTVGRLPLASRAVARWAKRRYTTKPRTAPIQLTRRICLEPERIVIDDRLVAATAPRWLYRTAGFSPAHVPSAPLWRPSFEPLLLADGPDLASLLRADSRLDVRTEIRLAGDAAAVQCTSGGDLLQEASLTP